MPRDVGFYWVKYNGEWIVAEYWQISNCCGWSMMEEENILFTDSDFEEVDERRIERTDRAILPKEDYNPIPDNPPRYISDNPYLCTPDIDKNPEWT